MVRELLFVLLGLSLLAILVPVGAPLAAAQRPLRDAHLLGTALERAAARRLLLPLFPSLIGLSALVGWVVVEPRIAERPPWFVYALAAPTLFVCSRALWRALAALRPPKVASAATVGIVTPKIVVDWEFAASLDESARAAMMAHERAHSRHRDPLRVWVAQILTDLQWPWPGAQARLVEWRAALELARDDEARLRVDGADLAAALLSAARHGRLQSPAAVHSHAAIGIGHAGSSLRARVRRLLGPLPRRVPEHPRFAYGLALMGTVLVSFFIGLHFGEQVVQGLFSP